MITTTVNISGDQNSLNEIIKLIDPDAYNKIPYLCSCNDKPIYVDLAINHDVTHTRKLNCKDYSYLDKATGYETMPLSYERLELSLSMIDDKVRITSIKMIHQGSSSNILTGSVR